MMRLPMGVTEGLADVVLSLGGGADGEPDPYTERYGCEILPGVFSGLQGRYYPGDAVIEIHAYVYDSNLADREMWELYLRLRMLSTLVHEFGNHYDHAHRETRGPWFAVSLKHALERQRK
ncbi:hypothetical protein ACFL2Q_05070 [Thermodesulfobacteriota bacterium]